MLDSPMFWTPDEKACPPTPNRFFPVPPGKEVGYGKMQTRRDISKTVIDRG